MIFSFSSSAKGQTLQTTPLIEARWEKTIEFQTQLLHDFSKSDNNSNHNHHSLIHIHTWHMYAIYECQLTLLVPISPRMQGSPTWCLLFQHDVYCSPLAGTLIRCKHCLTYFKFIGFILVACTPPYGTPPYGLRVFLCVTPPTLPPCLSDIQWYSAFQKVALRY